jgi:N utilization substance protein B
MQSFKGREKARRYAMQALYGWLISGTELHNIEKFYKADRNPKNYDVEYFTRLLHQIPANLADIDAEITRYIDRPFDHLDPIELTISRIATYELKFCFDIPFKVVIHEAIELAQMFASDASYKFINSVLDKMAKVMRTNEALDYAS